MSGLLPSAAPKAGRLTPYRASAMPPKSSVSATITGTMSEKAPTAPRRPRSATSVTSTAISVRPSHVGSEKSCSSSAPPPAYMIAMTPKSRINCSADDSFRSHASRSHGTSTASISAMPVREMMYISASPNTASSAIAASTPSSPPPPNEPKNCHSSCPDT